MGLGCWSLTLPSLCAVLVGHVLVAEISVLQPIAARFEMCWAQSSPTPTPPPLLQFSCPCNPPPPGGGARTRLLNI